MSAIKQGLTVSLLTLCSRILGFVREVVAAQLLGASAATDAFFAVFRLPNALRQLLAEGAFSVALVPLLHTARQQGGAKAWQQLAARVLSLLLILLLPLTLLGLLLAPWLVQHMLPELGSDELKLAVQLVYWTLPYALVALLIGWSAALLHAQNRFAVPALTPLLLSLSMIVIPLLFAPSMQQPVLALGIAVLVGGLLQLLWQGAALATLSPRPSFKPDWRGAEIRRIAALLLPSLIAASTLQLMLMIDTAFASRLSAGSVTWLYLAERIVQFPQGIIGTALSVVLVQRLASADKSDSNMLDRAMRLVLLLGMLIAVTAWCCAEPITRALYGYGRFTALDVEQTASALAVMACAVPAVLLVRALSAACLAVGKLHLLCAASALALGCDLVGNLALTQWTDGHAGHLRIAAVSACAAWVYAAALLLGLRRRGELQLQPGTGLFVLRVLLAAALCLWATQLLGDLLPFAFDDQPAAARLLHLSCLLGAAVSVYFASAWLLGLRLRHLR